MSSPPAPARLHYLALGTASAAALAYEILLLRVFGYSQWHHFASIAVALALLGFGAAGAFLTVFRSAVLRWGDGLFLAGLLGGAAGIVGSFLIGQAVPVRPLFAAWDARELAKLLVVDFSAFLPFFFLALAAGHVFVRWPSRANGLYGASLLGSGAGSLLAVLLLSRLRMETAVMLIPALLCLAALVFAARTRRPRSAGVSALALAALLGWMRAGLPEPVLSDFKPLARLLDLPGARVTARIPGLREEIRQVEARGLRIAHGLSLQWLSPLPEQRAAVIGSDLVVPLPDRTAPAPSLYGPAAEAMLTGVIPKLRPGGAKAWLGVNGWMPPLGYGYTHIHAFPGIWDEGEAARLAAAGLLQSEFGAPHKRFPALARTWSAVVFGFAAEGGEAVSEDYLMTHEGLRLVLNRLTPDGLLAIPLPRIHPPRYEPRLLRLVREALTARGAEDPAAHVALLNSMQASLFLVFPAPMPDADVRAIREFAGAWGFDLAALPGMTPDEANRFHQSPEPLLYLTARAVLSGQGPIPPDARWHDLRIPRAERPHFWKSMRWDHLPDLLARLGRPGLVWLDWSLLASAVKLLAAGLLAGLLILLPLRRLPRPARGASRSATWVYFSGIGLGYMLAELAVFQCGIRHIGDPVLSAALVFTVFLVGSGLGSLHAPSARDRRTAGRLFLPLYASGAFVAWILWGPVLPAWLLLSPAGVPVLLLALCPLAWSMGRLMPWGLRQLAGHEAFIPWAWGVNAFASVIAAPLATLVSVHHGQLATLALAAAGYLLAAIVAWRWTRPPA